MGENESIIDKTLDQSFELNKILADAISNRETQQEKTRRTPWIICIAIVAIVSIAMAVSICVVSFNYKKMHNETLDYFSQYEFYTETTVTQEQSDGGGNNNYFAENPVYNEAPKESE